MRQLCTTFITSSKVTADTVKMLNDFMDESLDFPPDYTNFFNPARHDASKILKPSEEPVDFEIDVFEGSYEEFEELRQEVIEKQVKADGYVETEAFAVLDERSADDNTVVICYGDTLYSETTDVEIGEVMRHWRVSFADAHELVGLIEWCEYDVILGYVIEAAEKYTNGDDIFEFCRGMAEEKGGCAVRKTRASL